MPLLRLLVVAAAALALAGCGSEASPPPPAPGMTDGYLQAAHEMGATGMTDEQLLAAGRFVCDEYGNMTGRPYSDQFAAYGDLFDGGLVPKGTSNDTLHAILNATPFLCLDS